MQYMEHLTAIGLYHLTNVCHASRTRTHHQHHPLYRVSPRMHGSQRYCSHWLPCSYTVPRLYHPPTGHAFVFL